tara:strand:+ start:22 stop:348 length:327 start_codon:yes stop_codon:yes gene_type:complete
MKDKRTYTHLKEHGEDMTHENESKVDFKEDRGTLDLSLLIDQHKKQIWDYKVRESEWIKTKNQLDGTQKIIEEMSKTVLQQQRVIEHLEHDNKTYKQEIEKLLAEKNK